MEAISRRKRLAVGVLEEYEPTRCLGKGGFGSVVEARHRVTGQTVAMKRLIGNLGQGRQSSAVMREKSFLEACSSNPFVVGFHGVEKTTPPLPAEEATVRAIMWQLLTGAKKMHAIHIVHRNIKPENILVDVDQRVVKICDFRIALRMSHALRSED
ncbi:hypothetical protein PR202_ga12895 [Eleusine coracana subsp. coracana]|uniref:non-specific serine/threonine protein kinase n=1 Tax=Eleusine coracana subsp. coracana TaxID=191504 RepID=A0AAV5CD94_ELECO|nr:hypothetical protein PR202_ga12895 [Eleusine coracana subsp. coracana]